MSGIVHINALVPSRKRNINLYMKSIRTIKFLKQNISKIRLHC